MMNKSSAWPEGSNDACGLLGAPMAIAASYINASMTWPSSGGWNQRERTNSESFLTTSLSPATMPYLEANQMMGCRKNLLQAPALASGASNTVTSALLSHMSRSALIGRL